MGAARLRFAISMTRDVTFDEFSTEQLGNHRRLEWHIPFMTAGTVKTFKQIRISQVSLPCPEFTGEVKHARLDQATWIRAGDG